MADVINAGLDPHRWFAAVTAKTITTDLSFCKDPAEVKRVKEYLEEVVSKDDRQKAKAANFGFPGALGARTFWRNCRESGIKISLEEAGELREMWINTFKEMELHKNPERIKEPAKCMRQYALPDGPDADESELPDEEDRNVYFAKVINGFTRTHCSFNAACNAHFQSLVAAGAKEAGWNLVYHGYGDRLYVFVHDEWGYWLYPDEVKEHVPRIEQLMLAGMRKVIPDVWLGVESSIMFNWDKGADTLDKVEWLDGVPVIKVPEKKKELLGKWNQA